MSEYNQYPERPDPIAERVGLDIFTDREQEMYALTRGVVLPDQRERLCRRRECCLPMRQD